MARRRGQPLPRPAEPCPGSTGSRAHPGAGWPTTCCRVGGGLRRRRPGRSTCAAGATIQVGDHFRRRRRSVAGSGRQRDPGRPAALDPEHRHAPRGAGSRQHHLVAAPRQPAQRGMMNPPTVSYGPGGRRTRPARRSRTGSAARPPRTGSRRRPPARARRRTRRGSRRPAPRCRSSRVTMPAVPPYSSTTSGELVAFPAHLGQRGEHPFAGRQAAAAPGQLADRGRRVGRPAGSAGRAGARSRPRRRGCRRSPGSGSAGLARTSWPPRRRRPPRRGTPPRYAAPSAPGRAGRRRASTSSMSRRSSRSSTVLCARPGRAARPRRSGPAGGRALAEQAGSTHGWRRAARGPAARATVCRSRRAAGRLRRPTPVPGMA